MSALSSFLENAENGVSLGFGTLTIPNGTSLLILGVVVAAVLIFRPKGITAGREVTLRLPQRWPRPRFTRSHAS